MEAVRRQIRVLDHLAEAAPLGPSATLADLSSHDCQIGDLVPGGEVIDAFRHYGTLPGAIVCGSQGPLGLLSRTALFGALGNRFAMEVFVRRPIGSMLHLIQGEALTLTGDTPVQEAVRRVLARPPKDIYEPVRITFPAQPDRVLDVHRLMLAQERLLTIANDEAARQRDAAHAAAAAKGRFLANMSHEMRTPLNGVLGVAELLRGTSLSTDQTELLDTLRDSAGILLELINDVLDSAKLDSDAVIINRREATLPTLCAEVVRMLAPRAQAKGVALRLEVDPALPPRLITDPLRLRQVLLNLIGNAVKFTDQGSVALEVRQAPGEDRRIRFAVVDTGIGIPADKREAIFDPFVQADETTTRRYGGTGLGLTIARTLVGLLGGELRLDSEEGQGSTFWFELPVAVPGASAPAEVPRAAPRAPARLDGLSVLVAEDNLVNQRIAQRLLERLGARVTVVSDGEAAVEAALGGAHFDVVLMDVQMPRLDGVEATARIRASRQPARARLPILAVTAHALLGDRERLLAAGLDGYIAKPIAGAALLEEISRVLGMSPG